MLSKPIKNQDIELRVDKMIHHAKVRMTKQRRAILRIILESDDHPSAHQIYQRAKKCKAGVSLATVYNCLETMVEAKLVNQLKFDNAPARYCSNEITHAHLVDEENQQVHDIYLKKGVQLSDVFELPPNICIQAMDICLRAQLPKNA